MPHPELLPNFLYREPEDAGDVRLLKGVEEHGWYVIGVMEEGEGEAWLPGFAYTIGVHLRTLQPEILIMGLPVGNAHRLLNSIAEYLMEGGTLEPEVEYEGFADDLPVIFRPMHPTQYHEHLGCANWFYRRSGIAFPAYQCVWPDAQGRFPHEAGFEEKFAGMQQDLSLPRG